MKRAAIVLATVFMLTGCAATPAPVTQTTAATAPAPAPAEPAANLDQWASVVAEQAAYLADWKDKWDEKECRVAPSSDLLCSMDTLTGTMVAQTVSTSLKIPTTATSNGYIGAVPSELNSLYTDTQSLADAAAAAGAAWSDACNADGDADGCFQLRLDFDNAVQKVTTKFAAWAPYL